MLSRTSELTRRLFDALRNNPFLYGIYPYMNSHAHTQINLFLSHSSDTSLSCVALLLSNQLANMQMMIDAAWHTIDEPIPI